MANKKRIASPQMSNIAIRYHANPRDFPRGSSVDTSSPSPTSAPAERFNNLEGWTGCEKL